MTFRETKAGHWFEARQQGHRLPEHEGDEWCDLCGAPCSSDDFNDTANMTVCPHCIESMTEAKAYERACETH